MTNTNSFDPYQVLGLPKTTTIDTLKKTYKQLALKNHPDRGGSEVLFKLIELSYRKILEKLKLKQIDKQFNELKSDFTEYRKKTQTNTTSHVQFTPTEHTNYNNITDFNTRFNKIFDDNRIQDAQTQGYKHVMDTSTTNREDIDIDKKMSHFTIETFNNEFNKIDPHTSSKKLMKYKEPAPIYLNNQLQFTELGIDKIDDFSGTNDIKNSLHYTDYMKAHTTSKLIDPSHIRSRTFSYKNINDIESDRDNISFQMNQQELDKHTRHLQKQQMKEAKRLGIIKSQDNIHANQHERLNKIMLQYRS